MSDNISKTIEELQSRLVGQLAAVKKTKSAINTLCEIDGRAIIYPDADEDSRHLQPFRKDLFYGHPLATCVRQVLELRRAAQRGPAAVNEIFDALVGGGYKFETDEPENAKRNLRISLAKNTTTFHKLPGGEWGLLEWYPNAKPAKPKEPDATTEGKPNDDNEPLLRTESQRNADGTVKGGDDK